MKNATTSQQQAPFKEQGGVATMNPKSWQRWLTSKVMSHISKPEQLNKQRTKFEKQRLKSGEPHRISYFHQVDDGYSALSAQRLKDLVARYDIALDCHLVVGPQGDNVAEPELLLQLSRYDAHLVAAHYGLNFPEHKTELDPVLVDLANKILAAQDSQQFINLAKEVSSALWAGERDQLEQLASVNGCATDAQCSAAIQAGTTRREQLKHYSGAMFYYAGEWYWGVDRLYHLEQRLNELGLDRQPSEPALIPRPQLETGPLKDDGRLTLEFYPSLRSPYTAIIFDRVVQLAKDTGVKLVVRPVLPMVMRGVPATREKGMYIFKDAAREARADEVPYGQFYDPIGDPVKRAYSLYPWACEQGKGTALLSAFLSCAFANGVNTNTDKGLKTAVEKAGLDWQQAKPLIGKPGWEAALEANRLAMYEAGLWGVPSFRLLDEHGKQSLALWGQDRLWLFSREIQKQLALRSTI